MKMITQIFQLVAFMAAMLIVLCTGPALADPGQGMKTTLTRDDPKPKEETPELQVAAKTATEKNCHWVTRDRRVQVIPGQLFVQPSTVLVGCYGSIASGASIYQMPASESVSTTYEKVCD